ncbi:SigB/SigF/SigG family RNA polymerase sigma factor [Sphaerisporangium sp. TRM90804]|uniref:SigB/SigF/SigG family RNA polymerase sigma factor n=1 Tax=Sphaerisporangium sp. TRM90804 TaxID=3031113 RepID=UPI002447CBE8|nr:SigB/SigF/SigG family RNA polymerase sigma factor [Sphaerisporangium sp. TRM90804]MDH2426402.1 SigB/SigF/SigG family RNA polymerase sigma factor [Sphaerisporangium sp. TRM90804]
MSLTTSGPEWTHPLEKRLFEQLTRLPDDHPDRERIRDDLARLHQGLVETLSRRFTNRGEPFEDLVQSGNVGLVKAINRFDVNRGCTFTSYAVPVVLGEIRRHFRDSGWMVHVPRRLQELKILVHSASDRMVQLLGRRPTPHELAQELDLTEEEAREGLRADRVYSCLSLDAMTEADNERRDESNIAEVDEDLELVPDRMSLWPLLDQLPERERTVLLLRFFGNQTQSEIATVLQVSQVHVSRIESKACSQLREQLNAA